MKRKIVVIDIETENTGYDIQEDNKRIISVQLYDGEKGEFFYADSVTNDLNLAKERIKALLNDGIQFVGYNIINFDIPMIKKFLELEIPLSQIMDISEMKPLVLHKHQLGKKGISLEDACKAFGVKCEHKKLLEPLSSRIKQSPEVIEKSKSGGLRLANKMGWGVDFSRWLALNKISGGMAILESYNEFVQSNGNLDSIFYRYAMGDVIAEYELYIKLKQTE